MLQPFPLFCVLPLILIACAPKTQESAPNPAPGAKPSVVVEDSGAKEIDDLVRQLVSTRPAPFPSGYASPELHQRTSEWFITPEVDQAIQNLRSLGPATFTNLVTHLHDDRYSYSTESAAWLNKTVGDAIMDSIFADGQTMHSGYKSRDTPTGAAGYLHFYTWVRELGEEAWAQWASAKTRLDIQIAFIDSCVEKENSRGFVDDQQRARVLQTYEDARRQMIDHHTRR